MADIREIVEYDILSGEPYEVARAVVDSLPNGWQPLGPAQAAPMPGGFVVVQTVVKYATSVAQEEKS